MRKATTPPLMFSSPSVSANVDSYFTEVVGDNVGGEKEEEENDDGFESDSESDEEGELEEQEQEKEKVEEEEEEAVAIGTPTKHRDSIELIRKSPARIHFTSLDSLSGGTIVEEDAEAEVIERLPISTGGGGVSEELNKLGALMVTFLS